MYPTKEEFEEILRTRNLERILDDFLFIGIPFSFSERPEIYHQMIGEISSGLNVPEANICVVGSGRIGFSLSPHSFGRPFSRHSDLDIIVVSPELFDPSWLDILTNRRVRWSSLRQRTREHLIEHREHHHIYNGWVAPGFVAEALDIGERWRTTFNRLSLIPYLSSRSIGGRLYRTWEHAKAYHRWSLRQVLRRVVG